MNRSERDLHVLKYFSSVVTVSGGKVINVTEPSLRYCPLANHFFPGFKKTDSEDPKTLCSAIREAIQSKIRDYGLFTARRSFDFPSRAVPFGASEMLAASIKSGFLDSAAVVCDGAGTVIANSPETVQGIGARMNTLIFTSPIKEIQQKLRRKHCHILSGNNAWIDQVKGVEKAVSLGYKKIGVTLPGFATEQLLQIRALEKKSGISVVILAVCTSGLSESSAEIIHRHADLVWSCASREIRERTGRAAILQLSKQIPVYVLTALGVSFVASCFEQPSLIDGLDIKKQYLISDEFGSRTVRLGGPHVRIWETPLPVISAKAPSYLPEKSEEVLV